MILAIDVAYHTRADRTEFAQVAGVSFTDWHDAEPKQVYKVQVQDVAPYQAGQFYKRELPCIMALLQQLSDAGMPLPDTMVVDGYVHLSAEQKAGLGLKLYEAIQEKWQTHIPIIGVAKNYFKGTPDECAVRCVVVRVRNPCLSLQLVWRSIRLKRASHRCMANIAYPLC